MKFGKLFKPGDVILTEIQFVDTLELKKRPALVLYEEFGNVVVAGVTSNLNMQGISLSVSDGAVVDSVIKLNYIMTISKLSIKKKLFSLSKKKKKEVFKEFVSLLDSFN